MSNKDYVTIKKIYDRLAPLIYDKDLSIVDLGFLTNEKPDAIYARFSYLHSPDIGFLAKVSELLGVSLDWLVLGEKNDNAINGPCLVDKKGFSSRLKKLTQDQGLDMAGLSHFSGVSYGSIREYLNGLRYPAFQNAQKLASAFDMGVDQLLFGVDKGSLKYLGFDNSECALELKNRVNDLLGSLDIPKTYFCAQVGVSRSTLRSWQLRESLSGPIDFVAIANFFGVHIDWLVLGLGDKYVK